MKHQTLPIETSLSNKPTTKRSSLRSRSDEVLIAVATLGLVATIVDGEPDHREIESFTNEFRKRFALSRRHSFKLVGVALRRIQLAKEVNIIDGACETLNEHLNSSQKAQLIDGLAEVLVADGKIHESEEYFFDYIARKLNIVESLERNYPTS